MAPNEVEGGAVPAASKSSWTSFLKSIASFNGDLSSLTAPAFILSSQSLVEFSAYWAENQSLFLAPTTESDPAKRMLLVTRWLLNTLHQQYCSRSEQFGNEKKPLNPFLGEVFLGDWTAEDGSKTTLVSEQVCHHPPVTAYCIQNDAHKIQLQGYNGQKASFSRTIHIKQVGHSVLTLHPPGATTPETYLITLPALHVENLIYGAPFMELERHTHIISSSGYIAKLDYSGKGWVSGKKNSFTAGIWETNSKNSSEKHPLYSLDGQWSDAFSIHTGEPKKHGGTPLDTVRSSDVKLAKLTTAPLEQQDPFESRRAWHHVALAVEKGDMDGTTLHKSKIENAQRALRKKEESQGREWHRLFFSPAIPNGPFEQAFDKLVHIATGQGSYAWDGVLPERTGGIWRFDAAKAAQAKKPFHPEAQNEAFGEVQTGAAQSGQTGQAGQAGQVPIQH